MANSDQRPLYQQSDSGAPEERSDHHDRNQSPASQIGEAGFRFECQPGCSACCETEGEVYLTEEDLVRISAHLSLDPVDFEAKYLHRSRRSLRLRKPSDRQCLFHRDNRCSIHPVKPVQCRVFPYWPEIIENRAAWDETALRCPGMNKGPLVQIETARGLAAEMLRAYPQMYT